MKIIEENLRLKIKRLQTELEEVQADRDQFRNNFSNDLKWLIKIHGERSHPNMSEYIESKAKFLVTVKPWHW